MSKEQKLSIGAEQLILFQGDFHAKTSATPATKLESKERSRDFGRKCSASFARFDQSLFLWRTYQRCLSGELEPFSETWPRSGTMLSGSVFLRQPLAQITEEIDCGLFPTVTSTGNQLCPSMQERYKRPIWPTPTAQQRELNPAQYKKRREKYGGTRRGIYLQDAVRYWPTPKAQNARGAGEIHGDGGLSLDAAVGGQLNPSWVEWLMGVPLGWSNEENVSTCSEMVKSPRWFVGSEKE